MRQKAKRRVALTVGALAVVLGTCYGLSRQRTLAADSLRLRGEALFHGTLPLVARLTNHEEPLPVMAVRCMNCHEALNAPPLVAPTVRGASGGSGVGRRPYGGVIQGGALTNLKPRRGGPPSAYDQSAVCKLLRTGIDPSHVIISNTMPRYETSETDCSALWAYLIHEPI